MTVPLALDQALTWIAPTCAPDTERSEEGTRSRRLDRTGTASDSRRMDADELHKRWLTEDGLQRLQELASRSSRASEPDNSWESVLVGFPGVEEVPGGRDLRCVPFHVPTRMVFGTQHFTPTPDFRRLDLQNTVFDGAEIPHFEVGSRPMVGASFAKCKLPGADFVSSRVAGINLAGATLTHAKFYNADLRGANLSHTDLEGADFETANLEEADLGGAECKSTKFKNAKMSQCNATGAKFAMAHLEGATAVQADFRRAGFIYRTSLQGANLAQARLEEAILVNATLKSASLQEAKCSDADFRESDLGNACLDGCDLRGADLSGTHLTGATFSRAVIEGANLGRVRFGPDHPALDDGSDALVVGRSDRLLNWSRIRVVGRLPMFGISWVSLGVSVAMVNAIGALNATQFVQTLHYPIPIPLRMGLVLITSALLGIASTIYKVGCPMRIQEFTEGRWVDELGHARILYLREAWSARGVQCAATAFYLLGGGLAVWLLGERIWRAAVILANGVSAVLLR